MKVLVTGSTSLIGRHVVERLVGRGDGVTTLQRSAGSPVAGVREVRGDINDVDAVTEAVRGQDAVVHLAAKVGVTGPWEEYHRVNVLGTRTVIDLAQRAGVRRFVHVSSPSVAHTGRPLVAADTDPADPTRTRGSYATSKAMAEQYALSCNSSRRHVVAIRPHLVWGPGDTQLVQRIVERARQGRLVTIGTGAALVDTTYVDNAADALVSAVDAVDSCGGQAFVVSNGEPRTVHEIVERIVSAAGLDPPRRRIPRPLAFWGGLAVEKFWERAERTDDPPMTGFLAEQLTTAHWFDQRQTRASLGWAPNVSLDEGFERLTRSFAALAP